MATLTVQTLDQDGIVRDTDSDIFVAAASGGDEYANDGRTFLVVKNTGVASRTVTITAQRTTVVAKGYGELTVSDITAVIDVTGNQDEAWILAPPTGYNDSNGRAQVTYSDEADLKVCAFRLADIV